MSEGHPRAPQPTPDFPRFGHAKQAVGREGRWQAALSSTTERPLQGSRKVSCRNQAPKRTTRFCARQPPKASSRLPASRPRIRRVGEGDLREGPLLRQMGRSPGGLIDVCIANDHPTRTGSFGPGLPVEAVRSLAMHGSIEEHVAVKDVLLAGKTPLHGDRLALRNLVARASLGGPDFEGPVDVGRSLAVRTSGRRPIGSTPDFVRGGRGQ